MKFNLSQPQRLKAVFVATVLGAAAIEGTVLAQKHHVPTGKDAFLHYQVDSTNELIQALRDNPTLRKNYARHFGIPEDQVIDFVKRTLVPYHLPTGRMVTTYGATKSGHIYPVHTYLKKGTLVWATRSGLPILKWACANPLTKTLPATLLSSRPKSLNVAPRHQPKLASVESPELPTTQPIATGEIPAPLLTPPDASESSALVAPPVLGGASSAILPSIAAIPIPVTGGGHGGNLLPLIPILVGVGVIGHGGGGSASNGQPPVIVDVPTPTPSAPSVVPTPTPSIPAVVPTPTPGVPNEVPTPSPSTPVVVPTPTPSAPSVVPTPTPSVPSVIPTPTPSVPDVVPTPSPYVPPTSTPTPGPSTNTPTTPIGPTTVPEPGSFALALLAGLPIAGGFAAQRRRQQATKSAE